MLKLSVLGQPFGSTLIYAINDPISASLLKLQPTSHAGLSFVRDQATPKPQTVPFTILLVMRSRFAS
jgi:hypothetical protein